MLVNLPQHVLTDSEEAEFMKGLNFGNESTLQFGQGMCCEPCCFEASANADHGVQVEDQVHVREV
jgi:hypothetical protein